MTEITNLETKSTLEMTEAALERKERTRKLINMGGLVVKADLEPLPSSTLYGGLLTLRNQLIGKSREEVYATIDEWTYIGKQAFEKERRTGVAVVLKFKSLPSKETLEKLKSLSLKWNSLRKEWEGVVTNIDFLKEELGDVGYSLQIL